MIEVYEWKAGETRPGSDRKPRHECIGSIAVPPHGQAPQKGDIIHILMPDEAAPDGGLALGLTMFVVLERELAWTAQKGSEAPDAWMKMWIHVRRVEDYTRRAGGWTKRCRLKRGSEDCQVHLCDDDLRPKCGQRAAKGGLAMEECTDPLNCESCERPVTSPANVS